MPELESTGDMAEEENGMISWSPIYGQSGDMLTGSFQSLGVPPKPYVSYPGHPMLHI